MSRSGYILDGDSYMYATPVKYQVSICPLHVHSSPTKILNNNVAERTHVHMKKHVLLKVQASHARINCLLFPLNLRLRSSLLLATDFFMNSLKVETCMKS